MRILVASLTAAGKQNDHNNNSRNSVKRISPNNASDKHEVGNPALPKKKDKNSSNCAGGPYGFEPANDSKMMDERGVEC